MTPTAPTNTAAANTAAPVTTAAMTTVLAIATSMATATTATTAIVANSHGPVGYNSCVGNLDGESGDVGVGDYGGYRIGGGCDYYGNDVYDGSVAHYDGYGDDGGSAYST